MALPLLFLGGAAGTIWVAIQTFLIRALWWLIPFIIHYGIVALGIGYVTYLGMDSALDLGIDFLMDRYTAMPSELVAIAEVMGVTDAISIITAAATSAVSLKITAGVTKMVVNRPATLKA